MKPDESRSRGLVLIDKAELTQDHVLVEISGISLGNSICQEALAAIEAALQASHDALAGQDSSRLERLALIEDLSEERISLCIRVVPLDGRRERTNAAFLLSKFLAHGTLAMLAWLHTSPDRNLVDLQRAIRLLMDGTAVPIGILPPLEEGLASAIAAWHRASIHWKDAETILLTINRSVAELEPGLSPLGPADLLVKTRLLTPATEMVLVVVRPDYNATGHWELQHGETRLLVAIEPGTMVARFHRRELDIRPGDALRCRARLERCYGPSHELIAENATIVEIIEVMHRPQVISKVAPAVDRVSDKPGQGALENSLVVEEIEGEFGTLTLRQIPIH